MTSMPTPAPSAPVYFPGRPGLPFSTAVQVGEVLYLSGQLGTRADGTLPEDFVEQSRQTMENIVQALESVGSSIDRVFKATIMLGDMSRWAEFNAVYLEYFDADRLPARSAFGAGGLALGAHLEVEVWAYAG